jgi:hypothetical protein
MMVRFLRLASVAALGLLIPDGSARAASVDCTPSSGHPVCQANYAAYPKGALAAGQASSGTATVNGKSVAWKCLGGIAAGNSSKPRQCTY